MQKTDLASAEFFMKTPCPYHGAQCLGIMGRIWRHSDARTSQNLWQIQNTIHV